jgi:hypothetical protein
MRSWWAGWLRSECQANSGTFGLSLGFLVLGVACRLLVYWLNFPIWRDEASLALNFVERDFRGLLRELDNFQVAPLLFLWIEKAVHQWLGGSALLLRLIPLLAGVSALLLFWPLTRLCLTPLPASLAVAFLAVAHAPIHLASMVKPYSLDLFAATLLLTLAVRHLRAPDRIGSLAALALLIPFVVAASYPAIFVAGAVSLVLSPVVWKQNRRTVRYWFVAFNVLCAATFLAHLRFVGREGHDPTLPPVETYMAAFWQGGFLPCQPLTALRWLVHRHTGHLFSYPLAFNGGGLLGLLLCSAGARALHRQRQLGLLALCLLPLALNFVAGVLHRYPYAGDQRLEQHLVPGLCLLLGSGLADILEKLSVYETWRKRWTTSVAGIFVLLALAGSVDDAMHPYHDGEAAWAADIARHLRREVRPQDRIVLPQSERFTLNCLRWQLLPFTAQMGSPEQMDGQRLLRAGGRLWFVDQIVERAPADREPSPRDPRALLAALARDAWHSVGRTRFLTREPGSGHQQVFHYCCDLHVLEHSCSQTRLW